EDVRTKFPEDKKDDVRVWTHLNDDLVQYACLKGKGEVVTFSKEGENGNWQAIKIEDKDQWKLIRDSIRKNMIKEEKEFVKEKKIDKEKKVEATA
ncbi:MAG: hypothetical protein PHP92_05480, partial [Candidatus Nanoarchaeia archaeon]|nr:hypothetical protein [Candidatus Nanoarchaeia archaeon]